MNYNVLKNKAFGFLQSNTDGRFPRRSRGWCLSIMVTLLLLIANPWFSTNAWADTPTTTESTNGNLLMVIAYAVIWVFVLFYLAFLGKKQTKIDNEIKELRGKIDAELGLTDET